MRTRRIPRGLRLVALVVASALLAALTSVAPTMVSDSPPVAADGNEAPGNPAGFRSLTAGMRFTCAILDDGSVRCWGDNAYGQLGVGDTQARGDGPGEMRSNLPAVALGTGRTAVALSAGFEHVCALLDNGTVKCWGHNQHGQLGQGDTLDRGDAAGEMGDSLPAVPLGTGRTALAVSAGYAHSCALLDNYTVKCWGFNMVGQLGLGDTDSRGDQPSEMGNHLPAVDLGTSLLAKSVATGHASNTTCALLNDPDQSVKCWGDNQRGQLGQGDTAHRGDAASEMGDHLPAVQLGQTATAVAVGSASVCAVLEDSKLKCWGMNYRGQLGLGDTADRGDNPGEMGSALPPVELGADRTVFGVSPSNDHTCALLDDYTVKCWGQGLYGRLGVGDTVTRGDAPNEMGDALPAVSLDTSFTAVAVTTGFEHSCAFSVLGDVKCWGRSDKGQLGQGDTETRGNQPGEMGDALPVVLLRATGVSGTVTEAGTGDPLSGIWVAVLRTTDFGTVAGPATGAGGGFSAEVPPGSYFLYVVDPTGAHTAGFHGPPTTVTVTANHVTTANPAIASTRGTIFGGVSSDVSGEPIHGAWAITLSATTAAQGAGTVTQDGKYRLGGLVPGNHFVAFVDPSGRHRPEFHADASSVDAASTVSVTVGTETEVNESLAGQDPPAGGAELRGSVTDSVSGQPLAGVWAIALHAANYSYAAGAATDAGGEYLLDLDPGSYKVEFVDPSGLHHMEWFDDLPYWEIGLADSVTLPDKAGAALAPTTGAIHGTITDDVTLAPLAGVWVIAIAPNGIAGGAITAADGTFTVSGLAPGTYRATFAGPVSGHTQEFWDDSPGFEGATPFNVTAGATVTVNAALHHP